MLRVSSTRNDIESVADPKVDVGKSLPPPGTGPGWGMRLMPTKCPTAYASLRAVAMGADPRRRAAIMSYSTQMPLSGMMTC